MTAETFLASCSQKGVELYLTPSGEIGAKGPDGVITDRFRNILSDYADLIRPSLPAPRTAADAAFDEGPGEEADATPAIPQKAKTPVYAVQLLFEEGTYIPWTAVCWPGKPQDEFRVVRHFGFGGTKAGALRNLLATMNNLGTVAGLRAVCERVTAELAALPAEEPVTPAPDLNTTENGHPPVFEFIAPSRYQKQTTLRASFCDGSYLESKGDDQGQCWAALRRHPAATPEQRWWIEKAAPKTEGE